MINGGPNGQPQLTMSESGTDDQRDERRPVLITSGSTGHRRLRRPECPTSRNLISSRGVRAGPSRWITWRIGPYALTPAVWSSGQGVPNREPASRRTNCGRCLPPAPGAGFPLARREWASVATPARDATGNPRPVDRGRLGDVRSVQGGGRRHDGYRAIHRGRGGWVQALTAIGPSPRPRWVGAGTHGVRVWLTGRTTPCPVGMSRWNRCRRPSRRAGGWPSASALSRDVCLEH